MNSVSFVGVGLARDSSELVHPIGPAVQPDYVRATAFAQERAGFDHLLVGDTRTSPDAFTVAAALLGASRHLGVAITLRPENVSPTAAARAIATLDAFYPGRVAVHLPAADGDGDGQRRRAEFADVLQRAWSADLPFDHDGGFYRVTGGWTAVRPSAPIRLFVSGASPAADQLATRHGDVYFVASESPDEVARRIADVTDAAARHGRSVRFGLRVRPIVAPTRSAANAVAERVLRVRRDGSAPRMATLRAATGALAGLGSLIGTVEDVAETLVHYRELGVSVLRLSGFEPLADAARFGQLMQLVHELTAPAESLTRPA